MQHLGAFNQKQILYTRDPSALTTFKGKNWLAMIVAQKFSAKTYAQALAHIMAQEPLFVQCCCSNATDMEDAVADLLCEKYPGFDDDTIMPMTWAESDLQESLRFCIHDAFHEEKPIEEIVIIDLEEPFLKVNDIEKILAGF